MTTLTKGNRVAKINNQEGSFYTQLLINTNQVVQSKFHNTINGAKKYANKHING